jgi:protein transport protein SEC24
MQVMQDDQKTKSGYFYANQKGQVPPLVTTDFVVQDQGNCSPRFIRSTMYSVPINADIMKQVCSCFVTFFLYLIRQVKIELFYLF